MNSCFRGAARALAVLAVLAVCSAAAHAAAQSFPSILQLLAGWQPEGIAAG